MIVHEKEGPFGLMLLHWRGSAIARIWPLILLVGAISAGIEGMFNLGWVGDRWSLTPTPFSLIGVALGIFLGFRNNACYDRYWEARKAWGSLVNSSRSLAREAVMLVKNEPSLARQLIYRHIAFAHALRMRLRGETAWSDLARWIGEDEALKLRDAPSAPSAVLRSSSERIRLAWREGHIDTFHVPILEQRLVDATDVLGICERIQNTPLPTSYTILTHRIVGLYCLLLPFGLHGAIGPGVPLVTMFVAYAFLGLDTIGTEIEDPFGTDENDLPLESLCRVIERDLLASLGEQVLPPPLRPDEDGVLI